MPQPTTPFTSTAMNIQTRAYLDDLLERSSIIINGSGALPEQLIFTLVAHLSNNLSLTILVTPTPNDDIIHRINLDLRTKGLDLIKPFKTPAKSATTNTTSLTHTTISTDSSGGITTTVSLLPSSLGLGRDDNENTDNVGVTFATPGQLVHALLNDRINIQLLSHIIVLDGSVKETSVSGNQTEFVTLLLRDKHYAGLCTAFLHFSSHHAHIWNEINLRRIARVFHIDHVILLPHAETNTAFSFHPVNIGLEHLSVDFVPHNSNFDHFTATILRHEPIMTHNAPQVATATVTTFTNNETNKNTANNDDGGDAINNVKFDLGASCLKTTITAYIFDTAYTIQTPLVRFHTMVAPVDPIAAQLVLYIITHYSTVFTSQWVKKKAISLRHDPLITSTIYQPYTSHTSYETTNRMNATNTRPQASQQPLTNHFPFQTNHLPSSTAAAAAPQLPSPHNPYHPSSQLPSSFNLTTKPKIDPSFLLEIPIPEFLYPLNNYINQLRSPKFNQSQLLPLATDPIPDLIGVPEFLPIECHIMYLRLQAGGFKKDLTTFANEKTRLDFHRKLIDLYNRIFDMSPQDMLKHINCIRISLTDDHSPGSVGGNGPIITPNDYQNNNHRTRNTPEHDILANISTKLLPLIEVAICHPSKRRPVDYLQFNTLGKEIYTGVMATSANIPSTPIHYTLLHSLPDHIPRNSFPPLTSQTALLPPTKATPLHKLPTNKILEKTPYLSMNQRAPLRLLATIPLLNAMLNRATMGCLMNEVTANTLSSSLDTPPSKILRKKNERSGSGNSISQFTNEKSTGRADEDLNALLSNPTISRKEGPNRALVSTNPQSPNNSPLTNFPYSLPFMSPLEIYQTSYTIFTVNTSHRSPILLQQLLTTSAATNLKTRVLTNLTNHNRTGHLGQCRGQTEITSRVVITPHLRINPPLHLNNFHYSNATTSGDGVDVKYQESSSITPSHNGFSSQRPQQHPYTGLFVPIPRFFQHWFRYVEQRTARQMSIVQKVKQFEDRIFFKFIDFVKSNELLGILGHMRDGVHFNDVNSMNTNLTTTTTTLTPFSITHKTPPSHYINQDETHSTLKKNTGVDLLGLFQYYHPTLNLDVSQSSKVSSIPIPTITAPDISSITRPSLYQKPQNSNNRKVQDQNESSTQQPPHYLSTGQFPKYVEFLHAIASPHPLHSAQLNSHLDNQPSHNYYSPQTYNHTSPHLDTFFALFTPYDVYNLLMASQDKRYEKEKAKKNLSQPTQPQPKMTTKELYSRRPPSTLPPLPSQQPSQSSQQQPQPFQSPLPQKAPPIKYTDLRDLTLPQLLSIRTDIADIINRQGVRDRETAFSYSSPFARLKLYEKYGIIDPNNSENTLPLVPSEYESIMGELVKKTNIFELSLFYSNFIAHRLKINPVPNQTQYKYFARDIDLFGLRPNSNKLATVLTSNVTRLMTAICPPPTITTTTTTTTTTITTTSSIPNGSAVNLFETINSSSSLSPSFNHHHHSIGETTTSSNGLVAPALHPSALNTTTTMAVPQSPIKLEQIAVSQLGAEIMTLFQKYTVPITVQSLATPLNPPQTGLPITNPHSIPIRPHIKAYTAPSQASFHQHLTATLNATLEPSRHHSKMPYPASQALPSPKIKLQTVQNTLNRQLKHHHTHSPCYPDLIFTLPHFLTPSNYLSNIDLGSNLISNYETHYLAQRSNLFAAIRSHQQRNPQHGISHSQNDPNNGKNTTTSHLFRHSQVPLRSVSQLNRLSSISPPSPNTISQQQPKQAQSTPHLPYSADTDPIVILDSQQIEQPSTNTNRYQPGGLKNPRHNTALSIPSPLPPSHVVNTHTINSLHTRDYFTFSVDEMNTRQAQTDAVFALLSKPTHEYDNNTIGGHIDTGGTTPSVETYSSLQYPLKMTALPSSTNSIFLDNPFTSIKLAETMSHGPANHYTHPSSQFDIYSADIALNTNEIFGQPNTPTNTYPVVRGLENIGEQSSDQEFRNDQPHPSRLETMLSPTNCETIVKYQPKGINQYINQSQVSTPQSLIGSERIPGFNSEAHNKGLLPSHAAYISNTSTHDVSFYSTLTTPCAVSSTDSLTCQPPYSSPYTSTLNHNNDEESSSDVCDNNSSAHLTPSPSFSSTSPIKSAHMLFTDTELTFLASLISIITTTLTVNSSKTAPSTHINPRRHLEYSLPSHTLIHPMDWLSFYKKPGVMTDITSLFHSNLIFDTNIAKGHDTEYFRYYPDGSLTGDVNEPKARCSTSLQVFLALQRTNKVFSPFQFANPRVIPTFTMNSKLYKTLHIDALLHKEIDKMVNSKSQTSRSNYPTIGPNTKNLGPIWNGEELGLEVADHLAMFGQLNICPISHPKDQSSIQPQLTASLLLQPQTNLFLGSPSQRFDWGLGGVFLLDNSLRYNPTPPTSLAAHHDTVLSSTKDNASKLPKPSIFAAQHFYDDEFGQAGTTKKQHQRGNKLLGPFGSSPLFLSGSSSSELRTTDGQSRDIIRSIKPNLSHNHVASAKSRSNTQTNSTRASSKIPASTAASQRTLSITSNGDTVITNQNVLNIPGSNMNLTPLSLFLPHTPLPDCGLNRHQQTTGFVSTTPPTPKQAYTSFCYLDGYVRQMKVVISLYTKLWLLFRTELGKQTNSDRDSWSSSMTTDSGGDSDSILAQSQPLSNFNSHQLNFILVLLFILSQPFSTFPMPLFPNKEYMFNVLASAHSLFVPSTIGPNHSSKTAPSPLKTLSTSICPTPLQFTIVNINPSIFDTTSSIPTNHLSSYVLSSSRHFLYHLNYQLWAIISDIINSVLFSRIYERNCLLLGGRVDLSGRYIFNTKHLPFSIPPSPAHLSAKSLSPLPFTIPMAKDTNKRLHNHLKMLIINQLGIFYPTIDRNAVFYISELRENEIFARLDSDISSGGISKLENVEDVQQAYRKKRLQLDKIWLQKAAQLQSQGLSAIQLETERLKHEAQYTHYARDRAELIESARDDGADIYTSYDQNHSDSVSLTQLQQFHSDIFSRPLPQHLATVQVDSRELRGALVLRLYKDKMSVRVGTYTTGDYLLLNGLIGIERKAPSDLIQSLDSGRLVDQLMRMKVVFKHPVLLIEFNSSERTRLQKVGSTMKAFSTFNSQRSRLPSTAAKALRLANIVILQTVMLLMKFPQVSWLWSNTPATTSQTFALLQRHFQTEQPDIGALMMIEEDRGENGPDAPDDIQPDEDYHKTMPKITVPNTPAGLDLDDIDTTLGNHLDTNIKMNHIPDLSNTGGDDVVGGGDEGDFNAHIHSDSANEIAMISNSPGANSDIVVTSTLRHPDYNYHVFQPQDDTDGFESDDYFDISPKKKRQKGTNTPTDKELVALHHTQPPNSPTPQIKITSGIDEMIDLTLETTIPLLTPLHGDNNDNGTKRTFFQAQHFPSTHLSSPNSQHSSTASVSTKIALPISTTTVKPTTMTPLSGAIVDYQLDATQAEKAVLYQQVYHGLLQFPGISRTNIHSILQQFESIQDMCLATKERITQCIGVSAGTQLHSFLHKKVL